MAIKIQKKPNESAGGMVRRFSQQVRQSGVLKEVKKRAHWEKPKSKRLIKKTAIIKAKRKVEYNRKKRMGTV